jgi:hypothetical protein
MTCVALQGQNLLMVNDTACVSEWLLPVFPDLKDLHETLYRIELDHVFASSNSTFVLQLTGRD